VAERKGKSVLLVDDDEDLRELLAELLVGYGADRCVVAGSLVEVQRQAAETLECSIAILDVNLGAGAPTGVAICQWLRVQGFTGRVVFLTGHASDDPRVAEAARVPNTRVLSKPLGVDQIAALLEDVPSPSDERS
jgi:DNA-binding response OmpR family regulator